MANNIHPDIPDLIGANEARHLPRKFERAEINQFPIKKEDGTYEWVNRQYLPPALDIVDGANAPPTEVHGDVYVLNGGFSVHNDWDLCGQYDQATYDSSSDQWNPITPVAGYEVYNITDNSQYLFTNSWATASALSQPAPTSITYSALSTLKTNGTLIEGTTYYISDRYVWVVALSVDLLSLEGGYYARNADYQNSGDYTDVTIANGFTVNATGTNRLQWHAGYAGTLNEGDCMILDGLNYLNINGGTLGTLGTSGDGVNWEVIPNTDITKTATYGYIEELDKCEFDFDNDHIQRRIDIRGNDYAHSYYHEASASSWGFDTIPLLQWGNDEVFGNKVFSGGILNNLNSLGHFSQNVVGQNRYISGDFTGASSVDDSTTSIVRQNNCLDHAISNVVLNGNGYIQACEATIKDCTINASGGFLSVTTVSGVDIQNKTLGAIVSYFFADRSCTLTETISSAISYGHIKYSTHTSNVTVGDFHRNLKLTGTFTVTLPSAINGAEYSFYWTSGSPIIDGDGNNVGGLSSITLGEYNTGLSIKQEYSGGDWSVISEVSKVGSPSAHASTGATNLTFDADKNYASVTQTGAISFTMNATLNVDGKVQSTKIVGDSTNTITFSSDFTVISGAIDNTATNYIYFDYIDSTEKVRVTISTV